MKNQNRNNDENSNSIGLLEDKGLNSKDITVISILTIFVFFGILLIFQLISYISNIDFLAPFPGINFIITPICIAITFIAVYILNKSKYMIKILSSISKLISWARKYPLAYKVLRFIYKHPLISAVVVGIIWAIIKNVFSTYFT
jgi:hypothetical protein